MQIPLLPQLNASASIPSTITSSIENTIMQPVTLLYTLLSASLPFLGLSFPSSTPSPPYAQGYCKPLPNTPAWPSDDAWMKLNESIGGNLVSPPPPGAVCHPSWPERYSNDTCTAFRQDWINSSWHAANPITSDYNDDTCIPYPEFGATCSRAGYPAYTVNASDVSHVVEAVKFVKESGVRLVIKGTGHDFPGRSAGRNSLSIHTHHLRNLTVTHGDPRAVKYGGTAAVKISAGLQMRDLYARMVAENLTLVGGADPDVGIGGWTGGGGHSPVSAMFGLGADNVIEMEVVTADGEFRVLNGECEDEGERDLFWALRGGGPSTYAVLVSVTMIAYPSVSLTNYIFLYNTTASSAAFWNMTALFHQHLPKIAESGGMGYYFTLPNISILATENGNSGLELPFNVSLVPPEQQGLIFGTFLFNASVEETTAVMAPVEAALRSLSDTQADPIHAGGFAIPPMDFSTMWSTSTPQTVGSTATRLGSWLLGQEGLSRDLEELASAFKTASGTYGLYPQLGHLVSGPGSHGHAADPEKTLPGGGNALLPAWRTAYTHVVMPGGWAPGEDGKDTATKQLQERVDALRALEPGSGAYMNEADPTNELWKEDYFGKENYERLLRVKRAWDPEGVFWCRTCVGSEFWEWSDAEGVGVGQGVGQEVGRLCWKGE